MKASAFIAAFLSAAVAYAQAPVLNTPDGVPQCRSTLLTWTGDSEPFVLSIHPGGDPSAAAIRDLGEHDGNEFSWFVDIPAGTSVFARLRDDEGRISNTAPFTIQDGPTDCLNGSSGGGSSSTTTDDDDDTTTGGGGTTTGGGGTTTGGGGGTTNTRTTGTGTGTGTGSAGSQETDTTTTGGAGVQLEAGKSLMVAGAAALAMAVFA